MRVKMRERRFQIRIIFLLVAQTVCLLAAPAQTQILLQRISGALVCEETEILHPIQASASAHIRKRAQHFRNLAGILTAAVSLSAAAALQLPAYLTPVRRRVRLND